MKNYLIYVGEGGDAFAQEVLDEIIRISKGRAIVIRESTKADLIGAGMDMDYVEREPSEFYRTVVTND